MTDKAPVFAMTARIILEELSEMMECSNCDNCPMRYGPDCLFDAILPRLREIEEGEKKGSEK